MGRDGVSLETKLGVDTEDTELPHRMIARAQRESDPFVDAIIRSIPAEERESFSDSQISALSDALTRNRLVSKHIVDARITIPLYFTRFYAVFLIGKDRRTASRAKDIEHRRRGSTLAGLLLAGCVGLGMIVFVLAGLFMVLYLLKTALGIDIFPDTHLWDLLSG